MQIVGVSTRLVRGDPQARGARRKDQWAIEQALADWLTTQSALVAAIPPAPRPSSMQIARSWIGRIDALVLQGGENITLTGTGADNRRDDFELGLLGLALERGIPVLGICRGMQLINVALGGSLRRVDCAPDGAKPVHSDAERYEAHTHPVRLSRGCGLAQILRSTEGDVCSMHGYAIDTIGSGLEVEAWCPQDDTIEAIRLKGAPWVRGVQWHPEHHRGGCLPSKPLLNALVEAADR